MANEPNNTKINNRVTKNGNINTDANQQSTQVKNTEIQQPITKNGENSSSRHPIPNRFHQK